MARPQRNNVDYFPFICEDGEKMHYIEQTYGNDGFAVFVKLLRELAKKDFHYLNLSDKPAKMFLASKCRVSIETLTSIIEDLVSLGKFDKVLWNESNIIWCQDFIDSIQDAYLKRNNKCITYEGLLQLLTSLGVRKPTKSTDKGGRKPQSKEEDSKGKESKEEDSKEGVSDFEILEQFPFEEFWNTYDKKNDRLACEKKFAKLSEKEKELIWGHVPKYVASTPDKQYRKNPETYLNNKCWNDEIITTVKNGTGGKQTTSISDEFDRQFFANRQ